MRAESAAMSLDPQKRMSHRWRSAVSEGMERRPMKAAQNRAMRIAARMREWIAIVGTVVLEGFLNGIVEVAAYFAEAAAGFVGVGYCDEDADVEIVPAGEGVGLGDEFFVEIGHWGGGCVGWGSGNAGDGDRSCFTVDF